MPELVWLNDWSEKAARPMSVGDYASRIATEGMNIAQVNIALPQAPLDSPRLAEFVAALAPVNTLADAAPGFVWRLQTDDGDATGIRAFGDDRLIVNMSVWESIDALAEFVYRSGHVAVMRRRRDWFERIRLHMVLWWIPAGVVPTVGDAEERLAHLREHGPTPFAFTFKARFALGDSRLVEDELGCPA
jgi:hypothetical protein